MPTPAAPAAAGSTWLDAQYDIRHRVPDFAGHFRRWRAASVLARERADAWLGLRDGDGETLAGENHFGILQRLVEPGSRLHALALRLLGLH